MRKLARPPSRSSWHLSPVACRSNAHNAVGLTRVPAWCSPPDTVAQHCVVRLSAASCRGGVRRPGELDAAEVFDMAAGELDAAEVFDMAADELDDYDEDYLPKLRMSGAW